MKEVAERMQVPRALHTRFPVGLSLGKPKDPEFQQQVLQAAFDLLRASSGPVLQTFAETIASTGSEPLTCPLPPRLNTEVHPAVDESQALKGAYDRACKKNGRTSVGMQINAEEVPEAISRLVEIGAGESWDSVGFPEGSLYGTVHDIRSYYEELACELAEGPITPWSTEEWFYEQTEAGQAILHARRVMRANDVDPAVWFGLAPAGRE